MPDLVPSEANDKASVDFSVAGSSSRSKLITYNYPTTSLRVRSVKRLLLTTKDLETGPERTKIYIGKDTVYF